MKMINIQVALLMVYFCTFGTAMAENYRLDFFGVTYDSSESYSGYAIIDYSTPNGSNSDGSGSYESAITHFELQFRNGSYVLDQNDPNVVSVTNDSDHLGSDSFSFGLFLIDTADYSEAGWFHLTLRDPSMTVFSGIALPTDLSIGEFDLDQSGTLFPDIWDSTDSFHPLEFFSVTPVPLPSALVLLISGLTAIFTLKYRRR